MGEMTTNHNALETLIAEAKASGGSELSNYGIFIERLCLALGLPGPDMAKEANELNDYVLERRVDFKHPDGTRTAGRIDCYKRGCFVLEAKQSGKRQGRKASADQLLLLPEDAAQTKPGQAKRGTRGWDQVMLAARRQAEDYSRALPIEHGYPPFLLVVDVGNVIEVYADFSGQGKYYAHFPDRQTYRIGMDDLRDLDIQNRLRAIWTAPLSLDPTRISAEVTRDIAERLARIAKRLEGKHDPKDVAEFLMRCLFTMFAEDVGLLPDKSFHGLLGRMRDTPENFVLALESLWTVMDKGGYAPHLNETLKRFNGALFKDRRALPLDKDDIHELWIAAGKDWSDVEPAIFGTLVERALDPRERSKLGAHYTPRTYVERLVVPTIIEPLRDDWELVQSDVKEKRERGQHKAALDAVKAFHHTLCTTRVLDPACGTGNFLYVSLELMKRLEGEVLEALEELGEDQARFVMEGETVSPRQFYGLELNPRAVPIADLVLWIGYLKWQLKTSGLATITEPILDAYGTIRQQDAIIAYDRQEMLRDDQGRPLSRWDGVTKKLHPITGEEIPDPDATLPLYSYVNPRQAAWPKVDFIVGNPPFIGNKRMRDRLGIGYVDAIHKAYPRLGGSLDFVMYWWARASEEIERTCRTFGFVTTNSIRQSSNASVVRDALRRGQRIAFAVPDHPWVDDGAAVRVSMAVVDSEIGGGRLDEVIRENPATEPVFRSRSGNIGEKLRIGADFSRAAAIISNSHLSFMGVIPVGMGFVLNRKELASFGIAESNLPAVVKPYQNGRDLVEGVQDRFIIDFFGLSSEAASTQYPALWQRLHDKVKPVRDQVRRETHRKNWWIFGEARPAMRQALQKLDRYIGTTETAKHRLFSFIPDTVLPDQKIRVVALDAPRFIALLSSRPHALWAERTGGRQGIGNDLVYNNVACFDPFPFPVFSDLPPTNLSHLDQLGERLDGFRKERLKQHSFLTMTGLYNALERFRELENGCNVPPLTDAERDVHQAGLISVLKEIHDDIDRATLTAYGWEDLIPELVGKPGATLPSLHKSEVQEQAEEELLSRLVALNQGRAAEEKRGIVRWLRPDYQIPKLGPKAPKPAEEHVGVFDIELPDIDGRPKWPSDGLEQIRLVRDLLAKAPAPAPPDTIAMAFDGRNTAKRRDRIDEVLRTLVETGLARTGDVDGQTRYFLPR